MGHCFVIQPFDGGEFDRRFDQVIAPAIEQVDLKAYRVDRDPSTTVAIDMIHTKISSAMSVIADITLDNANVWYELGYAMAVGHAPIMLCSDKRETKFPFDVQHRIITRYNTEAPEDFEKLKASIVERLEAPSYRRVETEPVDHIDVRGLEPHEVITLVSIASEGNPCSLWWVGETLKTHGFNQLAARLAVETLKRAELLLVDTYQEGYNDEPHLAYDLTPTGIDWLVNNQRVLDLKSDSKSSVSAKNDGPPPYDPDEEPF